MKDKKIFRYIGTFYTKVKNNQLQQMVNIRINIKIIKYFSKKTEKKFI